LLDKIEKTISWLRISPDGRWLVTGSQWADASLCDLTASNPAKSYTILRSIGGSVGIAIFSPDSKYIMTAAEAVTSELSTAYVAEPIARVWSLSGSTPQIKAELKGHTDVILDAVFLGDGNLLATSGFDGTTRIWNLAGETVSVLRGHDGPVFRLTSNPKGNLIATASQDGTARIWPVADLVPSPILLSSKKPTTLSVSGDGQWLFAGGAELSRWNLKLSRPALSSETRTWALGRLVSPSGSEISANGRWLATRLPTQNGDVLMLWDLQKGLNQTGPVPVQRARYDVPKFALTDDWLIFTVRRVTQNHQSESESYQSELQLWDLNSNALENKAAAFGLQNVPVTAIAVTADGSRLAIAAADETVSLVHLSAGTAALESKVKAAHGTIILIEFSPKQQWLIGRGNSVSDHTVRLWKMSGTSLSDEPVMLTGHTAQLLDVTASPDDRFLVTMATGEGALVWNLNAAGSSRPWLTLPIHSGLPGSATFSPDGRWLVTTGYQEPTQLWDLSQDRTAGLYPAYLRGHLHPMVIARFTPDSHWLITADTDVGAPRESDKTCRLWDLQAQDPAASAVLLPKNHLPFGADGLDVSPDGRWLITSSVDGLRLWHLGTTTLMELAQVTAGRDFTDDERRQYDLAFVQQ